MLRKDEHPIFIDKVGTAFETHKNEEHIEVEIRLGKHNGSLFDTNVGKEIFERVLKGLKKYDGWESMKTTTTDVYYDDTNHVRISSDEDTSEQTMIQKIKVLKDDFKCEPLDVRFSISREIPTIGQYEMDRKRNKLRHSFVRKNVSIDMTISTGDTVDMDTEDASSYQIELEIIKPGDVTSYNQLFNILHKISDLSKLI